MGRFSTLTRSEGKEITIGDEKFSIKPLVGKYLGLFMDMEDSKKKESVMKKIILISLQETDSTITEADIDELPLKHIMEIFEVISEVNELG